MAAVAAQKYPKSRNPGVTRSVSQAATKVYSGLLVMVNAAGFGDEALAAAANLGCHGVAAETVDNSGGAAGDKAIIVKEGEFLLTAVGAAQADVGKPVYASNGNTVSITQAANEPRAGIITGFVSATSVWVKVGVTEASDAVV